MAWLDRDRMPVRFAVATSVVSGLIVAAIVGIARGGVSGNAILVWFISAAGGAATILWIVVSMVRHFRNRSGRAFVMTSAFSQKYYVAEFVQRLHATFDRDGIDMVLKVPDRDYDASAQSHHLDRILDRKHGYMGGVIVAAEVHRLRDDLTDFCQKFKLPVVFTDLEPFDKESDYPDNSAFIGYDTAQLGALAGEWLVKRLRRTESPRVLIIASGEHGSRQERCAQVLRRELSDVVITIDDSCGFTRSRSYEAVRSHVRQLDSRQHLSAIFCTNDEMALGAVDALLASSSVVRDVVVVGVDGVLEAKALIDADSPLRATVVQDTHRLAMCVVDHLVKMHSGRAVPKRTFLTAEVYEAG
jgi:ribose transport system substrate-binding protein